MPTRFGAEGEDAEVVDSEQCFQNALIGHAGMDYSGRVIWQCVEYVSMLV